MPLALVSPAFSTGGAAVDKAPSPTTVPGALVGAALGTGGAPVDGARSTATSFTLSFGSGRVSSIMCWGGPGLVGRPALGALL